MKGIPVFFVQKGFCRSRRPLFYIGAHARLQNGAGFIGKNFDSLFLPCPHTFRTSFLPYSLWLFHTAAKSLLSEIHRGSSEQHTGDKRNTLGGGVYLCARLLQADQPDVFILDA